jgi:hypothetical protein
LPDQPKGNRRIAKAVEPMLEGLSSLGRRELERALAGRLTREATPAERRAAELGALAGMLNERTPDPGWSYAMIEQAEYDERRPADAPAGSVLSKRHSGWKRVCKAAYGLRPNGRTLGRSHHAWPHEPGRGRPRVSEYAFDEVIMAIRRCGLELACRPMSTTYMRWYRAKRQLARERGMSICIPNIYVIYRHFAPSKHGARDAWRRAVAAAALTDDDLRAAFARCMHLEEVELTAADELDEATIDAMAKTGVTEVSISLMQEGRPGDLPLSQAVLAARALNCSLSYLTRVTSERERPPDAGLRFDHAGYARRRKEAGLSAEHVRAALQLSPRNARRLALGTREPTVGQLTLLEQMLQLPPRTLASGDSTGTTK